MEVVAYGPERTRCGDQSASTNRQANGGGVRDKASTPKIPSAANADPGSGGPISYSERITCLTVWVPAPVVELMGQGLVPAPA